MSCRPLSRLIDTGAWFREETKSRPPSPNWRSCPPNWCSCCSPVVPCRPLCCCQNPHGAYTKAGQPPLLAPLLCTAGPQISEAGQLAQYVADNYMVPLNAVLNCSAGRSLAIFHCNMRPTHAHARGLCGFISTASLHCRPLCCWPGTASSSWSLPTFSWPQAWCQPTPQQPSSRSLLAWRLLPRQQVWKEAFALLAGRESHTGCQLACVHELHDVLRVWGQKSPTGACTGATVEMWTAHIQPTWCGSVVVLLHCVWGQSRRGCAPVWLPDSMLLTCLSHSSSARLCSGQENTLFRGQENTLFRGPRSHLASPDCRCHRLHGLHAQSAAPPLCLQCAAESPTRRWPSARKSQRAAGHT